MVFSKNKFFDRIFHIPCSHSRYDCLICINPHTLTMGGLFDWLGGICLGTSNCRDVSENAKIRLNMITSNWSSQLTYGLTLINHIQPLIMVYFCCRPPIYFLVRYNFLYINQHFLLCIPPPIPHLNIQQRLYCRHFHGNQMGCSVMCQTFHENPTVGDFSWIFRWFFLWFSVVSPCFPQIFPNLQVLHPELTRRQPWPRQFPGPLAGSDEGRPGEAAHPAVEVPAAPDGGRGAQTAPFCGGRKGRTTALRAEKVTIQATNGEFYGVKKNTWAVLWGFPCVRSMGKSTQVSKIEV